MHTYISRVKIVSKQLTNTAEIVSTTNLINKTISGLIDLYDTVRDYLRMDATLTHDGLAGVVIAKEERTQVAVNTERERVRDRDRSRERQRFMDRERSRERDRSERYRQRERSRSRNRRRCISRSIPAATRQRSSLRLNGRRSKFCMTCDMFGHDEETYFTYLLRGSY